MTQPRPFWRRHLPKVTVVVFFAYLIALTYMLWKPRPLAAFRDYESYLKEFFWTFVDPIAHLLCFTGLGFLASLIRWRAGRPVLLALLLIYAVLTEVVQIFIPERTAEWGDLAQDALGLFAGMVAAAWVLEWFDRRRERKAAATLAKSEQ